MAPSSNTAVQKSIFLNATIIDGTGSTPRHIGTVVVQDGRIEAILKGLNALYASELDQASDEGTKIVDCENGKWSLSPGFIDMHAHSDLPLLHTPAHPAKITQGVTLEVIGQDGLSYAPCTDTTLARIRAQIAGWNGNPADEQIGGARWRNVGELLDVLDREGVATNVAFLVPQGNLRALVKGWSSDKCSAGEIEEQKRELVKGLHQGAVGMSSGLTYVPGGFADTVELEALCKVVEQWGGFYAPHHRSYGKGALGAYAEMLELARSTRVRLHLTHATMNYPENAGRAGELLEMIDKTLADGCDVTLDTYPYLPGSTTLASALPSWAAASEDKAGLLRDRESKAKIQHALEATGSDGLHGLTMDYEIIEISGVHDACLTELYVGKSLAQIAREQGKEPFEVYIGLLLEDDFNSTILSHAGHEANVRKIMAHPRHTGGSDGILVPSKPHPRGWGTFARYLGHYARDLPRGSVRDIYLPEEKEGEMAAVEPETVFKGGLEEAVAHLTSRPAAVIGMTDRGLVKKGYRADLVLFDPETILDTATFARPKRAAKGIRSVMVNGGFAVDQGVATGERFGRTVRGKSDGHGGRVVV